MVARVRNRLVYASISSETVGNNKAGVVSVISIGRGYVTRKLRAVLPQSPYTPKLTKAGFTNNIGIWIAGNCGTKGLTISASYTESHPACATSMAVAKSV